MGESREVPAVAVALAAPAVAARDITAGVVHSVQLQRLRAVAVPALLGRGEAGRVVLRLAAPEDRLPVA